MGVDLSLLTAGQALVFSKMLSGKTNEQISEGTGWSMSQVQRFFNEHDEYFPSLPHLPTLEKVLGNTVIRDWMAAQSDTPRTVETPIKDSCDLLTRLNRLAIEQGEVCTAVAEALEDNRVSQVEAQRICGELHDVETLAIHMRESLANIAKGAA